MRTMGGLGSHLFISSALMALKPSKNGYARAFLSHDPQQQLIHDHTMHPWILATTTANQLPRITGHLGVTRSDYVDHSGISVVLS
jgi:hypothetical protein